MLSPLLRRLTLGLFIAAACAPSADAQAPTGQCNILDNERVERRLEAGVPMIYVTGPFLIRCPGGEELRALSGTVNEWTREILLTGSVFFQDPTRTLTANQATYWANLGRLYATGNVVFSDRQEGSTIRGPELEYFRVMEGRPEAQVNAAQRPHLTLRPRQAAADAEPLEIDADRVSIAGENNLSAYGNVIIRRTDLHATAEEAFYNSGTDQLDLRQNARIQSEQFNLSGWTVHARLQAGALEYVHARTDATLVGDELRVDAPDLQLFFSEDLLQRAVARTDVDPAGNRTGRAVATARAFRLEGDSIDAATPNQKVDQVIAIRPSPRRIDRGDGSGRSGHPTAPAAIGPAGRCRHRPTRYARTRARIVSDRS
jgi:lipopolysaccharide export system protein LptA